MQNDPNRMTRVHYMLLLLVLVLGAGLRIHDLGKASLWYDETYLMEVTEPSFSMAGYFDPSINTDPPLFLLVGRAWRGLVERVFGFDRLSEASDFALRLLPCIAGIVAMALVFAVCRAITQNAGASIAAAYLYAISPYQIFYAQELRNYTVYTVMCLLALWCLVRALEGNRFRHWAALTALLALLMYTHYFSIWTIAVFNLYFVLTIKKHWPRLRAWILCQATVLVCIVPALLSIRVIVGYYNNIQFAWYPPTTWKTALVTFKIFFAGYSPNAMCYWSLFALGLALFGAGIWSLRRRPLAAALLLCVAVVPVAGSAIVWSLKEFSIYEHRLFVFSGAVTCCVVAMGLLALPKRWMTFGVLAVLTGLTIPCLADHYSGRIHPVKAHRIGTYTKVDYRSMARYLREHQEAGDILGYPGHFERFSCNYYCDIEQYILGHGILEQDLMVAGFGNRTWIRNQRMLPEPVQDVAARARRIWLVEAHGTSFDTPQLRRLLREWLEANAFREDYQVFDGVTLTCYRMLPEARGQVRRAQIADLGDAPLVHYYDPPADSAISNQLMRAISPTLAMPREQIGLRFELSVVDVENGAKFEPGTVNEADGGAQSVLAVDTDAGRALLASFPLTAEDAFSYRFVVTNPTGDARHVRCTVLESAAVVEPVAYWRDEPLAAAWSAVSQYDCHDPARPFLMPALSAHLRGSNGVGGRAQAPVLLDAGEYTAFARVDESPAAYPQGRAQVELYLGPSEFPVGGLDGLNPDGTCGWTWRRVNTFRTDGVALTLTAVARNENDDDDAWFSLGRVLFTRGVAPEGGTPFVAEELELPLAPFEEKVVSIEGRLDGAPYKRVDIDVLEPVTKVHRVLTFYVVRSAPPAPASNGTQRGSS
ncbi:MAG: hypothetical protein GWP08_15550 [Nitrospiraceae bacterium]|nr:hypothetical protein [Nitrospiraceae bacterium]